MQERERKREQVKEKRYHFLRSGWRLYIHLGDINLSGICLELTQCGMLTQKPGSLASLGDWLFWHHWICTCWKELDSRSQNGNIGGKKPATLEWKGANPLTLSLFPLLIFLFYNLSNNKWNLDIYLNVTELQIYELPLENPEDFTENVREGQEFSKWPVRQSELLFSSGWRRPSRVLEENMGA